MPAMVSGFSPLLISVVVVMVLAGLILVPVVSIFTKSLSKDFTESVFSCYNYKALVPVTDAIGSISEEEENENTTIGQ